MKTTNFTQKLSILLILLSLIFTASYGQNYSNRAELSSMGGGKITGANYSNFSVIGETLNKKNVSNGTLTTNIGFLYARSTQPILSVSPETLHVSAENGTGTFYVSNTGIEDMPWQAEIVNSPWLSITGNTSGTNDGTITVSYATNTGAERTSTIIITAEGATNSPDTVEIRQEAGQDYQSLVALYNSANGDSWTNNTNWLTDEPIDTWYGVTVLNDHVTELTLQNNNLSGTIPAEIGNMDNLAHLYLTSNQLTGTIPVEIGNLANLTELSLSQNQLTGAIPAEIGNLANLTSLYLYSNQLTGAIPAEIGNLTGLTHLYLNDNQHSGAIPPEIGNLTGLTSLHLNNNLLVGAIPPEIGSLSNLAHLHLNNNQLTSIPPEIGSLNLVTHLQLNDNQLTGSIPAEIGNLTNLEILYLYNNQLTGTIPSEIGNLANLEILYLYDNQLTGTIPLEIGNLAGLKFLYLNNNQLSGTVPAEIANLTNLATLHLHSNDLENFPDISPLTALTLKIGNNKLTFEDIEPNINIASIAYSPQADVGQEIDTTVVSGTDFACNITVNGDNNQYQWCKDGVPIPGATSNTYTIPNISLANSGDYTCLITNTVATDLTLYSMPIHVTVEQQDLEYEALVALYNSTNGDNWTYNTNWLSDEPIDTWYGVTVTNGKVTEINLKINNLSGTIPSEIGNLTHLTRLYLYSNKLTGTIPPEIGNLTSLDRLYLYSNQLTGTIPAEIGNLTNLDRLYLYSNKLTGAIPAEIGNLTNLTSLYLSNNQLTGIIPSEIGNLASLTSLYLNGNQLTGAIPSEIGNLANLVYLYLYSNQLTGTIPAEIGNLTKLSRLYANSNQLTGSIPSEIGNLTNLTYLYLNYNQLTGSVPSEISQTSLRTLFLYNNQLEDLPDISSLASLNLNIQNNKFTFEDIEPNINVSTITYSPQDNVGQEIDTTVVEGTSFTFDITVGGANNQYQWNKNSEAIDGATNSTYIIPNISLDDTGDYTCTITNTVAAGLSLYSRPTHLVVTAPAQAVSGKSGLAGTGNFVAEQLALELDAEMGTLQDVVVYPIPAKDNLHIVSNQFIGDVQVEIYSLTGECVYKNQINSPFTETINVSHFRSGTYILRMKTDHEIVTSKIVILK